MFPNRGSRPYARLRNRSQTALSGPVDYPRLRQQIRRRHRISVVHRRRLARLAAVAALPLALRNHISSYL